MKIQVYLDGVTGERLAALAASERRSLSQMAAMLIERGLGGPPLPRSRPVIPPASGTSESSLKAQELSRVPPEPPEPRGAVKAAMRRVPESPVARAIVVDELQRQVAGVKPASQVCARERFHRPGVYCKTCGESF